MDLQTPSTWGLPQQHTQQGYEYEYDCTSPLDITGEGGVQGETRDAADHEGEQREADDDSWLRGEEGMSGCSDDRQAEDAFQQADPLGMTFKASDFAAAMMAAAASSGAGDAAEEDAGLTYSRGAFASPSLLYRVGLLHPIPEVSPRLEVDESFSPSRTGRSLLGSTSGEGLSGLTGRLQFPASTLRPETGWSFAAEEQHREEEEQEQAEAQHDQDTFAGGALSPRKQRLAEMVDQLLASPSASGAAGAGRGAQTPQSGGSRRGGGLGTPGSSAGASRNSSSSSSSSPQYRVVTVFGRSSIQRVMVSPGGSSRRGTCSGDSSFNQQEDSTFIRLLEGEGEVEREGPKEAAGAALLDLTAEGPADIQQPVQDGQGQQLSFPTARQLFPTCMEVEGSAAPRQAQDSKGSRRSLSSSATHVRGGAAPATAVAGGGTSTRAAAAITNGSSARFGVPCTEKLTRLRRPASADPVLRYQQQQRQWAQLPGAMTGKAAVRKQQQQKHGRRGRTGTAAAAAEGEGEEDCWQLMADTAPVTAAMQEKEEGGNGKEAMGQQTAGMHPLQQQFDLGAGSSIEEGQEDKKKSAARKAKASKGTVLSAGKTIKPVLRPAPTAASTVAAAVLAAAAPADLSIAGSCISELSSVILNDLVDAESIREEGEVEKEETEDQELRKKGEKQAEEALSEGAMVQSPATAAFSPRPAAAAAAAAPAALATNSSLPASSQTPVQTSHSAQRVRFSPEHARLGILPAGRETQSPAQQLLPFLPPLQELIARAALHGNARGPLGERRKEGAAAAGASTGKALQAASATRKTDTAAAKKAGKKRGAAKTASAVPSFAQQAQTSSSSPMNAHKKPQRVLAGTATADKENKQQIVAGKGKGGADRAAAIKQPSLPTSKLSDFLSGSSTSAVLSPPPEASSQGLGLSRRPFQLLPSSTPTHRPYLSPASASTSGCAAATAAAAVTILPLSSKTVCSPALLSARNSPSSPAHNVDQWLLAVPLRGKLGKPLRVPLSEQQGQLHQLSPAAAATLSPRPVDKLAAAALEVW